MITNKRAVAAAADAIDETTEAEDKHAHTRISRIRDQRKRDRDPGSDRQKVRERKRKKKRVAAAGETNIQNWGVKMRTERRHLLRKIDKTRTDRATPPKKRGDAERAGRGGFVVCEERYHV